MVVLCGLNEFGHSSDSVFRGVCECQLVYETLISDSSDSEDDPSQIDH